MKPRSRPPLTFIRKLCADLPEEKINEAEERFWRYLEIVRRIAQYHQHRAETDPTNTLPRFDKPENGF
jgi:hypothetical protein